MSDLYSEILVSRLPQPIDVLKRTGLIAGVIVSLAGSVMITPVLFLAAIAFGVGIWYFFPRFNVEYEYLIVNKDMDIDIIYSRKKRKKGAEFNLNDMDILAPLKSHRMDYYNGNTQMKICDFTSGRNDITPYAMVIKGEKVLLELDQETVENMRRTYPNKVFLD